MSVVDLAVQKFNSNWNWDIHFCLLLIFVISSSVRIKLGKNASGLLLNLQFQVQFDLTVGTTAYGLAFQLQFELQVGMPVSHYFYGSLFRQFEQVLDLVQTPTLLYAPDVFRYSNAARSTSKLYCSIIFCSYFFKSNIIYAPKFIY